jgi:hypothetical protein
LGLLILIATPVARVLVSIFAFVRSETALTPDHSLVLLLLSSPCAGRDPRLSTSEVARTKSALVRQHESDLKQHAVLRDLPLVITTF